MWPFRKKTTNYRLIIFTLVGLAGLIIGWLAAQFYLSYQQTVNFDDHFEVNFMEPQTAIVFWHSPRPGVGYVKYGINKVSLSETASQTSSQPTVVHAVIIDQVPPEGLYITTHTQEEGRFKISQPVHIQYDPSSNQLELEELVP